MKVPPYTVPAQLAERDGKCSSVLISRRSTCEHVFSHRWEMTQSYEDILKELSAQFSEQYKDLEKKRSTLHAQISQLTGLLQTVNKHTGAFDAEDSSVIEAHINTAKEHIVQLEADMAKHDAQRKEQTALFKCMEKAIQERCQILEGGDGCLGEHPELLQFFARKQVSLQLLLASKMRDSCATQSSTCG